MVLCAWIVALLVLGPLPEPPTNWILQFAVAVPVPAPVPVSAPVRKVADSPFSFWKASERVGAQVSPVKKTSSVVSQKRLRPFFKGNRWPLFRLRPPLRHGCWTPRRGLYRIQTGSGRPFLYHRIRVSCRGYRLLDRRRVSTEPVGQNHPATCEQ